MGFFNFNKSIKHRSFDYTPRYYDPEKEALKERLGMYEDKDVDQNRSNQKANQKWVKGEVSWRWKFSETTDTEVKY